MTGDDDYAQIGARVKWYVDHKQPSLTHRAVAQRIGMTPDAFSRSLTGSRKFTALELASLADLCDASLYQLVTGEQDPSALRLSARHSYDKVSRAYDEHDWAVARESLEPLAVAYKEVGAAMNATTSKLGADESSPTECAQNARRKLCEVAGPDFLQDFPLALEKAFDLDVSVLTYPKDFEGEAYAGEVGGRCFICVAQSTRWYRVNFALAHELGHVFNGDLDEFDSGPTTRRADERWANAFAAELLLPENEMRDVEWGDDWVETAARMIWTYEVSVEALSIRLGDLGIAAAVIEPLKATTTERLLLEQQMPAGDLQAKERKFTGRRMPPRLLRAQQEAFTAGAVTGRSLAWLLELPFDEINPHWGSPPEHQVDDLIEAFGL